MTQAKVWKMREYWMYFAFFILHDWDKRSAEALSSHYTVLPYFYTLSRILPSVEMVTTFQGISLPLF